MKILIIEDEKRIARFLELELSHEGYEVELAWDGRTGLAMSEQTQYDLILLDILMPELNGYEVCRRLRKRSNVPILILSAKDEVFDKVQGLDLGANDYLTKPFAIEELLARIRVHLRIQSTPSAPPQKLGLADLEMDLNTREVFRGGKPIELTQREFELLKYLLENPHRVLSRVQISTEAWGYQYMDNTNIIDVYIRYLRNKIDDPSPTKLIHTVRGIGYVLKEEPHGDL